MNVLATVLGVLICIVGGLLIMYGAGIGLLAYEHGLMKDKVIHWIDLFLYWVAGIGLLILGVAIAVGAISA